MTRQHVSSSSFINKFKELYFVLSRQTKRRNYKENSKNHDQLKTKSIKLQLAKPSGRLQEPPTCSNIPEVGSRQQTELHCSCDIQGFKTNKQKCRICNKLPQSPKKKKLIYLSPQCGQSKADSKTCKSGKNSVEKRKRTKRSFANLIETKHRRTFLK